MIRAFLYDGRGHDRELKLGQSLPKLSKSKLLWVDAESPTQEERARLRKLFGLSVQAIAEQKSSEGQTRLNTFGSYLQFDLVGLRGTSKSSSQDIPNSTPVTFVFGELWLLTLHSEEVPYLSEFRKQDRGETMIGALTGADLVSSLLGWHLDAYLSAAAKVESLCDAIDMKILARPTMRDGILPRIVGARRFVAHLLRLLQAQRQVFYGLSRPDIETAVDDAAKVHLQALAFRYERTFDVIQNSRSLVKGSFELHAAQIAESTNVLLRRLTFLSVTLGIVGSAAGIFGMNFDTRFARLGEWGFWMVLGALAITVSLLTFIFRWRKLI
jgi:magnesium transporter